MVSSMESWNRGMGERAEELEGVGVLVRTAELRVSRRKDKGDHHTQRSQEAHPPPTLTSLGGRQRMGVPSGTREHCVQRKAQGRMQGRGVRLDEGRLGRGKPHSH